MPARRPERRLQLKRDGRAEPSGKVDTMSTTNHVRKRHALAALVTFATLAAAPAVGAQGRGVFTVGVRTGGAVMATAPFPPPFEMPRMGDGPARVLPLLVMGSGLSEEQHAQVRQILEGQRATLDPLFEKLATLNGQLADKLLSPGEVAEGELAALVKQIGEAREGLIQNGVKVALQVRGVLTPEQLAKAESVQERLQELEAERRQLLGGDKMLFLAN